MLPSRRRFIFAISVLSLALLLGAAALFWRPIEQVVKGSGVALVGGPFSLTNQDGKRITEKDFLGKYTLYFFGYTYCPDVCPTELQVMTAALDQMGADGEKIQPVFVSIDPQRDTPEVLKSYVSAFGPRLVGLTGTPEEIANVAKAFRVYYRKASEGETDYLMDHSSIIYLMGPDGSFVRHFSYSTDVKALADGLRAAISPSS